MFGVQDYALCVLIAPNLQVQETFWILYILDILCHYVIFQNCKKISNVLLTRNVKAMLVSITNTQHINICD